MSNSSLILLRPDDRAILDALADGPLSAQEISDRIRRTVRAAWSEKHGYDFEWETDEEPLGARLLAHGEARDAGLKLLAYELHPRLRSLEKRGALERIQIAGKRPMLWSRRV
jgi:DNA-binding transcriptional ArsR family regulator